MIVYSTLYYLDFVVRKRKMYFWCIFLSVFNHVFVSYCFLHSTILCKTKDVWNTKYFRWIDIFPTNAIPFFFLINSLLNVFIISWNQFTEANSIKCSFGHSINQWDLHCKSWTFSKKEKNKSFLLSQSKYMNRDLFYTDSMKMVGTLICWNPLEMKFS